MEIMERGNKSADILLLQPVDEHDLALLEQEISLIREHTGMDFCMAAFRVRSWNDDLSPWEAPPAFGKEGFSGGADATLKEILGRLGFDCGHCVYPQKRLSDEERAALAKALDDMDYEREYL